MLNVSPPAPADPGLPNIEQIQVNNCKFRAKGYYALKLRDECTDVRRCEWNDLLNGIDIYDEADEKLYATIMDPRVFNRICVGRLEATPAILVVEGEIAI